MTAAANQSEGSDPDLTGWLWTFVHDRVGPQHVADELKWEQRRVNDRGFMCLC